MTTTPRLVKPLTQVNTTDNLLQFSGQIVGLNSSDDGYVMRKRLRVPLSSSTVPTVLHAKIRRRDKAVGLAGYAGTRY